MIFFIALIFWFVPIIGGPISAVLVIIGYINGVIEGEKAHASLLAAYKRNAERFQEPIAQPTKVNVYMNDKEIPNNKEDHYWKNY